MSISVMTTVWQRAPVESGELLLLLALADNSKDSGRSWPGVKYLAKKARMSRRNVQLCLRKLERSGMISVVPHGGRNGTNAYRIQLQYLNQLPIVHDDDDDEDDIAGDENISPPIPLPKGGENISRGGEVDFTRGAKNEALGGEVGFTQTVIEPSRNLSDAQARERGDLPDDGKGKSSDDQNRIKREFQALVNNWPGFRGLSLASAWREYLSMTLDDRSLAARKKDQWLRLLKSQGKDHVPAPSTYFRERLWEAVPDLQDVAAESRKSAAPFGKAWMHHVLTLLNQPAEEPPPPTAFLRKIIEDGGEMGRRAIRDRKAAFGWPKVNRLFEIAKDGQGCSVAVCETRDLPEMEAIEKNSRAFDDWRVAFFEAGLPWMTVPDAVQFVWMPKGGPDAWLTQHPHPPLGPSSIPTPCGAGRPRHFASDGVSKPDLTSMTAAGNT
jgi:hypothetical protein